MMSAIPHKKPVIGYTTRDFSWDPLQWLTALAIWITGGRAVRIKPSLQRVEQDIDGLVIGGGADLYPELYKGKIKAAYRYDRPRDDMEIHWLDYAEKHDIPVLGICRGAQMMNVYRGGTLHMDIFEAYENAHYPAGIFARIFYRKPVSIQQGSLLYRIWGQCGKARVNAMHTQSVHNLGQGLEISAKEQNGIVQAIEIPEKDYYLGVQFHPEAMIYSRLHRHIFAALVKAARRHALKRPSLLKNL